MFTFYLNLKSRVKNKAFWLALISWGIIIAQIFGFDSSKIIPSNYVDIINAIFGFLGFLGVVADTSTPGFSDTIITNAIVPESSKNVPDSLVATSEDKE